MIQNLSKKKPAVYLSFIVSSTGDECRECFSGSV